MAPRNVLVMGVGNPLMRDEGVGVAVAALLERFTFPEGVEVIDAGTMGYGIMNLFRGVELLVIADAVKGTDQPAGTVVRMTPDEVSPNQVMHSMHDVRLADVLQAAELMGSRPAETLFIGVQVELIEQFVEGLTPAVEAAVPAAAAAVLVTLSERDVTWQTPADAEEDAAVAAVLGHVASMTA